MANRRMFSKDVIQTEWFTDMPATAQMLYVHLSMDADDDGFVTNTKIAMLNAHASKDDLSILVAKSYVIPMEQGLYLLKHWRQNNYIQKDRYHKSDYADRLENYEQKADGSYTKKKACIQNGYKMDTGCIPSIELGKSKSKSKVSIELGNSDDEAGASAPTREEEEKYEPKQDGSIVAEAEDWLDGLI